MSEKLSILASVAVIAIAGYAVWLLADVDKAQIVSLGDTVNKINATLGTPTAPAVKDNTKTVLYAGIAILFVATIAVLIKKK